MLRARLLPVAVMALIVVPVSTAQAGIYTNVLRAYQVHGSVPPCEFSSPQLERALKGIDTYGAQYFQDFSSAVRAALSVRASGACAYHAALPPPIPIRTAGPPFKLGSVGAPTNGSVPAPIVLMAVLGVVLAVLGAASTFVLWRGWNPARSAGWRHSWSEAAYRAEGLRLEFKDWLRSGSTARD